MCAGYASDPSGLATPTKRKGVHTCFWTELSSRYCVKGGEASTLLASGAADRFRNVLVRKTLV
jgi:hypothetical protein